MCFSAEILKILILIMQNRHTPVDAMVVTEGNNSSVYLTILRQHHVEPRTRLGRMGGA